MIDREPSQEIQLKLENYLLKLAAAVYGDDHCWNRTVDPVVFQLLSGESFKFFMRTFLDITIRDGKEVSFCSVPDGRGDLLKKGLTSLKYQIIENPYKSRPGQPNFLPFRRTQELVIKCVVGTKSVIRGPRDVALSCIGQAYASYGSNVPALDSLRALYESSLREIGKESGQAMQLYVDQLSRDQLKSYRRKGITQEELKRGFPSLEVLIKKNEMDRAYHERSFYLNEWDQEFS